MHFPLADKAGTGFYVPLPHFTCEPACQDAKAFFSIRRDTSSVLVAVPHDINDPAALIGCLINELLIQECQARLNTVFPESCCEEVVYQPGLNLKPGDVILISHDRRDDDDEGYIFYVVKEAQDSALETQCIQAQLVA